MTRASLVVVALLAAAIAICSSCASLDSQFIPDQTFEGLGYWKYGFDDKLLYSLHWHGDTVRVRDGYGDNPDTFTIIASNCAGLNNAMSQLLRDVNTSVAAITDTTPRPPADEILLDSPLHKLVYQPLRRLDRLELSGFEEIPLQAWIKATESMRKIVRDCRDR